MKITEGKLESLLGNSDLVLMAYMTLAAIPIGDTVVTRYGKILRKSENDFKIEINSARVSKEMDKIIESTTPKDSVSKLFER